MKYIKKLIYVLLLTVATQVATAQIKILYGPYLQNVKENEATIVWVADKPSIGWGGVGSVPFSPELIIMEKNGLSISIRLMGLKIPPCCMP